MNYDPLTFKEVPVMVKKRSHRYGVIGFALGTTSFVALFVSILAGPHYMFWILGAGVVLMMLAALTVAPMQSVVDHIDLVPLTEQEQAQARATATARDEAALASVARIEAVIRDGGVALTAARSAWASVDPWNVTSRARSLNESDLVATTTANVRSSTEETASNVRIATIVGTTPLSDAQVEALRVELNDAVDAALSTLGKRLGIVR